MTDNDVFNGWKGSNEGKANAYMMACQATGLL